MQPDQERDPAPSWIDEEPGLAAAAHEVERVFRRARARPIATLLLAAMATLMVLGMAARRVKQHRARVILRYTERALAETTPTMALGELRNHVYSVVFSRDRLLPVIEKHGLYPDELAAGEDLALRSMRLDIDVAVFRNYFLVADSLPASARVAISYTSPERDLAVAVVVELAQAVVEYEAERRRVAAETSVRVAKEAVAKANAELDQRVQEHKFAQLRASESRGTEAAGVRVQLAKLGNSERAYRALLGQSLDQLERAELALGVERSRLAMGVEIARIVQPPAPPASRKRFFAFLGTLGFLLSLPLCAIFVGAMDSRVYELEDVERIGLSGLGQVPGFPGSDDGALAQRMDRVRRGWWRGLLPGPRGIRAPRR